MKSMARKKWKTWTATVILLVLIVNLGNLTRRFYPVKYMNYIKTYSAEYDVDPYLIMSIIKAESNFEHEAVSNRQASGLMQLMEPTALWLAEKMNLPDFQYSGITEPELNIKMGCFYVAYLLELYEGNEKNALAAYNAGEGTVSRWLADKACSKDGKTLTYIPYPETRRYITQVTNNQKVYQLLYKIRSSVSIQTKTGDKDC